MKIIVCKDGPAAQAKTALPGLAGTAETSHSRRLLAAFRCSSAVLGNRAVHGAGVLALEDAKVPGIGLALPDCRHQGVISVEDQGHLRQFGNSVPQQRRGALQLPVTVQLVAEVVGHDHQFRVGGGKYLAYAALVHLQ